MSESAEYNGKPIEGYSSDEEHFNGVLFYLENQILMHKMNFGLQRV